MKLRTLLAAGAAALAPLLPAHAQSLVFTTTLTGAAESPPNASTATGSATFTLDQSASTLHVQTSFSGLTSGVTAAHVHCCTAVAGEGTVPPATMLPSFAGFPSGVTSGTYDATFDMLDAASYNPAFVTANGTVEASFAALVAGMQAGTSYFNIHTTQFPTGEIRGFLQGASVAPVPEPQTYALMLAGLALVGWAARRRAH